MARALLADTRDRPQADGYRMNVIKTCWRTALMLRNWGRYDEALPYLDEAQGPDLLGHLRGLQHPHPVEQTAYERLESFVLHERARHELDAGRFPEALAACDRPLKFFCRPGGCRAGGARGLAVDPQHFQPREGCAVRRLGPPLPGAALQGLGRRAEAEETFAEGARLYEGWEKLPPPGAVRGDQKLAEGVRRYAHGPDQDARFLLAQMLERRGLLLADDPARGGQAEADLDRAVGLLERLARDFDFRASYRREAPSR